jgi:hypothetical protein
VYTGLKSGLGVLSLVYTGLKSGPGVLSLVYTGLKSGPGVLSRYSGSLRAGPSRDRMMEGARFYSLVHNSPGAHPASITGGTGSFPGAKRRGVKHPLHLAPKLKKE